MPLLPLSQYCIHATLISDCLAKKRGGEGHQRTANWHIRDIRCDLFPPIEKLVVIESPKTGIPHPLHFGHIQLFKKH